MGSSASTYGLSIVTSAFSILWCCWYINTVLGSSDNHLNNVEELWRAANHLWTLQQVDKTLEVLLQIQKVSADDPSLPMALGAVYQQKNDLKGAVQHYKRAIQRQPPHADLFLNIGQLYFDHKDWANAIATFQQAITLDKENRHTGRLLHLIGLAYYYQGKYREAEHYYRLVPPEAFTAHFHFDFGTTLEKLNKILEANDEYNKVLLLDQKYYAAWINIAALHQRHGDVNMSIPHYLRVIRDASTPDNLRLMAMTNVGVAYELTHNVIKALEWYSNALMLHHEVAFENESDAASTEILLLVHQTRAKKSACIWKNEEEHLDELLPLVVHHQLMKGVLTSLMPFDTLLIQMDPQLRKKIAKVHADQYTKATQYSTKADYTMALKDTASGGRDRLHIGYLSYDFSDHPTTHLLEGIFVTYDRQLTKVVAFGYGRDDGSDCRQRLIKLVDTFENLATLSVDQSVSLIQQHNIHILMDVQGFTRGGRMQILAARPAPIVVSFLAYPGTLGASFVDYVIADKHVLPPELARGFTEKVVLQPQSYQVNYYPSLASGDRWRLWGEATDNTTVFADIDDDAFVFVNFNKVDKLEATVFAMWMAILRRVPKSVLLLLDPVKPNTFYVTSDQVKRNLQREAAAQGVNMNRIHFVPRIPKNQHLRRHRFGNLFLDTFIYGAHSTATDALFAGLPFLTLAGDSFASRVGISLLSNLKMDELVTFSRKEYEDLAVAFAAHSTSALARLSQHLRLDDHKLPLFQTAQYTRNLEASQQLMFDIYSLTNRTYHIVV